MWIQVHCGSYEFYESFWIPVSFHQCTNPPPPPHLPCSALSRHINANYTLNGDFDTSSANGLWWDDKTKPNRNEFTRSLLSDQAAEKSGCMQCATVCFYVTNTIQVSNNWVKCRCPMQAHTHYCWLQWSFGLIEYYIIAVADSTTLTAVEYFELICQIRCNQSNCILDIYSRYIIICVCITKFIYTPCLFTIENQLITVEILLVTTWIYLFLWFVGCCVCVCVFLFFSHHEKKRWPYFPTKKTNKKTAAATNWMRALTHARTRAQMNEFWLLNQRKSKHIICIHNNSSYNDCTAIARKVQCTLWHTHTHRARPTCMHACVEGSTMYYNYFCPII